MWQIRKHRIGFYAVYTEHSVSRITLNEDYRILSCGIQGSDMVLWTLESTERDEYPIVLELVVMNTGNHIRMVRDLKHISTLTGENGIVWHIFEKVNDATH